MNVPETALHHQRLVARAAQLRAGIERLQAELGADPVGALERQLTAAGAAHRELELQLREREREVEAQRARLRARERELMSGRIKNPGELVKLSAEVEHMKVALGREEERELELMEQEERLQAELVRLRRELEEARARASEAAAGLRQRLQRDLEALATAESEREEAWSRLPPEWQQAYRRAASRVPNPVAEVVGGQCQGCRVGVTSSGLQVLRRGGLLFCDNCGRILVWV